MGYNLFAYCANNPINFKDISGQGIILACTLTFAVVGALWGGISAAETSKAEQGHVEVEKVVCGVVVGAGFGALIGWGVGTFASAIGIGAAGKTLGTLTPGLYQNWKQAEDAVRAMFNGVSQAINTEYGRRILDCLSNRTAYEAKYGYTCLTKRILCEIEKDIWLLANGYVDYVEWHFFVSNITNKGGASQPLIDALINAGIKIVYH